MIRKATIAGLVFAGIVGLSGCAPTMVGKYAANEEGYKQALADATAAADAAKKMNAEWRDIRWPAPKDEKKKKDYAKTLFGKAEAAVAEGDYETAIKLLNKATKHAELGQKQAEGWKNAGPQS